LRFSGAAVTYNANVSDVLGEIRFHTGLPSCAAFGVQARSVLVNSGFASTNPETLCWQARACAWVS